MKFHAARAASPLVLTLGLLGLAAAAPGCGTSVSGLCDAICDCTGCSDAEFDECVDAGEDAEQSAEDAGCSDPFDDYLSCIDDELECRDGSIQFDGCESEVKALAECGGGGIGTCDAAIAHVKSCGLEVDPSGCEGASPCLLSCVINAPCSVFTGDDPDATNAYIDCISSCDDGGGGSGGSSSSSSSSGSGTPGSPPTPDSP